MSEELENENLENEELEYEETQISIAGVDASEGESLVQALQIAKEEASRETPSSIKAKQATESKVSHKPNPVRSSQRETRRAVSSFQERRAKMAQKK